jgi:hypothetical protein
MRRAPVVGFAAAALLAVWQTDARADAPAEAARLIDAPARIAACADRFPGQARASTFVLELLDAGGDDRRPWLGVVERQGDGLWLRTPIGALRLRGTLARPRIAGPGYLVWVVGERRARDLHVARLGVLARPGEFTDWAAR